MEKSNLPIEDNRAPKSSGIIEIKSIYIDLKFPKQKNNWESSRREFSIRGCTAKTRKKNTKGSIPFASNADNNNALVEQENNDGVLYSTHNNASNKGELKNRHENSSRVLRRKRKFRSITELMADKNNLGYSIHSKVASQGQAPNEDIGTRRPRRKKRTPSKARSSVVAVSDQFLGETSEVKENDLINVNQEEAENVTVSRDIKKKKVKWADKLGKKLTEVKLFESSPSWRR